MHADIFMPGNFTQGTWQQATPSLLEKLETLLDWLMGLDEKE